MNVLETVRGAFEVALESLTSRVAESAQLVRPAQDAKFGDYQANCAMSLKGELRAAPREIAQRIVAALPADAPFASVEIAGPGFINVRLADDFLSSGLSSLFGDDRLGIEPHASPRTMVVDYSSPNVAKPMHVGHLRSTIIGDALARLHRASGSTVITDNHLGDWGTQFGMLIHGWRTLRDKGRAAEDPLAELSRLYPIVSKMASEDPEVAAAAREETAKLHAGDAENVALWEQFMPWCMADLERIYQRLDIEFDHQYGESFYQPMLAETVHELLASGVAEESDRAVCVFFPDPAGRTDAEDNPIHLLPPAIIRKTDGAFTYATSDLACIRYRVNHFHPDSIVYVVDDRQSDHFRQIFHVARQLRFDHVRLEHVAFGKITDKDGKPYKTREGGVVGLAALLD